MAVIKANRNMAPQSSYITANIAIVCVCTFYVAHLTYTNGYNPCSVTFVWIEKGLLVYDCYKVSPFHYK